MQFRRGYDGARMVTYSCTRCMSVHCRIWHFRGFTRKREPTSRVHAGQPAVAPGTALDAVAPRSFDAALPPSVAGIDNSVEPRTTEPAVTTAPGSTIPVISNSVSAPATVPVTAPSSPTPSSAGTLSGALVAMAAVGVAALV